MLARWLQRQWFAQRRLSPALWLLAPLAGAYSALAAANRARARPERLPVPVIVVGNVIAGGAGKTPAALAITEHLRASGWRPGLISRGHGRRSTDCREVPPDGNPLDTGDEPLLLRRRAQVPVFVASRRADAGRALLTAHPAVNVLICDDGLQHRAMARDVEVCVFDARGVGNGWLLPAGPLREAWPRAVDLVLHADDAAIPSSTAPAFATHRTLASHALRADGSHVPLASLRGRPLVALAGIAQPNAFFDMLREEGLALAHTVDMPDHDDFEHLPPLPLVSSQRATLLCTEKDAAKLWRHYPDALAVPLVLEVPIAFFEALDARLSSASV